MAPDSQPVLLPSKPSGLVLRNNNDAMHQFTRELTNYRLNMLK